jgi:tetratricopeptide (TPR) repeat protein
MKCIIASFTLLFTASVSLNAQDGTEKTIELKLRPAIAFEPNEKYQLLFSPEELGDSDALQLYEKAIQALPDDSNRDQIAKWVRAPVKELSSEQVKSTLKQFKPALQWVEQAANCRQCRWPYDMEVDPQELGKYRTLAYALALKARLEILQGQPDKAIGVIRTGFAMARHLAQGPPLTRNLIGMATAALMCGQLEQIIQSPNTPNLYWSLQALPRPLIDLTERIKYEDQPLRERIQQLMNRLDRHIALLQCIEALRFHAAAHNGKFPGALSDITQVPLPDDPVTKKPFDYTSSGSEAVLKGPAPKGEDNDRAIHYRLTSQFTPEDD